MMFMQDGAALHTARVIQAILQAAGIEVME
jgi:hypothetical protein